MASREFVIDWEDFTGGYHVGPSDVGQATDTWRGSSVMLDATDGMLVPARAWTATAYSSGTPTASTADTGVFMFHDNYAHVYRIYNTSATAGNICDYSAAGTPFTTPAAITNTAITTCLTVLAAEPWTYLYIFVAYTQSSGVNNLVRYNVQTHATTYYSIPDSMRLLARWGEFMIGVGQSVGYRLFFSDAYDPTTWGALNYVDIGDAGNISAIVPIGDALYVAKADSWWIVTGVLGSGTMTVRRVADNYPGPQEHTNGIPLYSAVDTPYGVMFSSPQLDVAAALISGSTARAFNYSDTGSNLGTKAGGLIQKMQPGVYALGRWIRPRNTAGDRVGVFILDARLGRPRWFKVDVPSSGNDNTDALAGHFARALPTSTSTQNNTVFVDVDTTIYYSALFPGTIQASASSVTATVHLVEKRRERPFEVKQLYVEVLADPAVSGTPTVKANVEMRGWPQPEPSPGRYLTAASSLTVDESSTPTHALYHDSTFTHHVYEFALNAQKGTGCVPVIEFVGCKIRRVWAVCADAGPS